MSRPATGRSRRAASIAAVAALAITLPACSLNSGMSGGQRQMLAVGRGLMAGCEILLLDEPTAGLSPKLISELCTAIREMNDRGFTVLLVEQNVSVVERTCERAYVLNGGEIVWEGPMSSIDRERIGDLYAGVRPPDG